MKPIAYDLCCGSGGWAAGLIAEGWQVIGYDIEEQPLYPGDFRLADVTALNGSDMHDASLIVASPPCEQFSRHGMPWTRKRNPPPPDLSIVAAVRRIAAESGLPFVMENVKFAQPYIGRSKANVGPYHLWGDVPSIIPITFRQKKKESYSSKDRLKRARVPLALARWVGYQFMPIGCDSCGFRFDARCGIFGCPNCHGEGLI